MVDSVRIKDSDLCAAASAGSDEVMELLVSSIKKAIGGKLTSETMLMLNGEQITLLAYSILRDEVMDGGFVQLIYNGYGGFIFFNPFAKMMREWGLADLASIINKGNKLYRKYREEIEKDCDDDEFMALFERFPCFDDLDDKFVENEEEWTGVIAKYAYDNIDEFAIIEK